VSAERWVLHTDSRVHLTVAPCSFTGAEASCPCTDILHRKEERSGTCHTLRQRTSKLPHSLRGFSVGAAAAAVPLPSSVYTFSQSMSKYALLAR